MSTIAEKHEAQSISSHDTIKSPSTIFPAISEKAEPSRPELSPRGSLDTEWRPQHSNDGLNSSEDADEENAAVAGLLRTIKKPLSSIGRIFSEDAHTQESAQSQQNVRLQRVQANVTSETQRRLSPAVFQPPRNTSQQGRASFDGIDGQMSNNPGFATSEAAARQASAEAAEARRIQRAEHRDVVESVPASQSASGCPPKQLTYM